MLPATFGGRRSLQTLTRDGAPVSFTRETIKGVAYAIFAAADRPVRGELRGRHGRAGDQRAAATAAATDGSATITWTTDEPSDSRVDYGTAPDRAHAERRPTPPT